MNSGAIYSGVNCFAWKLKFFDFIEKPSLSKIAVNNNFLWTEQFFGFKSIMRCPWLWIAAIINVVPVWDAPCTTGLPYGGTMLESNLVKPNILLYRPL